MAFAKLTVLQGYLKVQHKETSPEKFPLETGFLSLKLV
jgi:hypothetical protein